MENAKLLLNLDEKTGLGNYDAFIEVFENSIMESIKNNTDLSLVMIDIDNLGEINHDYGHIAGDKVLMTVTKYLTDHLPTGASIFRYNGDQFAMLFPETGKESAYLIIERLREHFEKADESNIRENTATIKCSFSAGVACCPEDGTKENHLTRRAHGAMLRSKTGGKNKVSLSKVEKFISKKSIYTSEQLHQLSILSNSLDISEGILLREALDDLFKKYDK